MRRAQDTAETYQAPDHFPQRRFSGDRGSERIPCVHRVAQGVCHVCLTVPCLSYPSVLTPLLWLSIQGTQHHRGFRPPQDARARLCRRRRERSRTDRAGRYAVWRRVSARGACFPFLHQPPFGDDTLLTRTDTRRTFTSSSSAGPTGRRLKRRWTRRCII